MSAFVPMQVEVLESRRLFSATALMSGKTLEVLGDPTRVNFINVEYTDSTHTTISVSDSVVVDPALGPTLNPSDFYGNFPAKGVRALYVKGGEASDIIQVGTTLLSNGQKLGFDINTRVDTLDGNNYVSAGHENITVNGGAGNDTINCGNGNDILRGNAGNDLLAASNGRDEISGGAGNDWIIAGQGRDTLSGGVGNDRIDANDLIHGGDLIFGGTGNDSITTGDGNDTVWGGAGNDSILAGSGHDVFGIGVGSDYCFNSAGSAIYYTRNINADVANYDPAVDKIVDTISPNETKDPVI